jgi:hypothetical protein
MCKMSKKSSNNRKSNNAPVPQQPQVGINPMFMNMFSSLLQQMNVNESMEIDELKEKMVSKILRKIGISREKMENMCENGEGHKILGLIDDLSSTKTYDFLIVYTYPEGNGGYVSFKGTYKDAKKHALECLGREHGMLNSLPDEASYLVRKYPVYTLKTDRVTIEVLPHASWVPLDME